MTLTYKEQLLHPNWQRRRLEMLNGAGWKCSRCGANETTLHVHHRLYHKGRMAWDYEDEELAVLCAACHSQESDAQQLLKRILAASRFEFQGESSTEVAALGILAGFFMAVSGGEMDPELFDEAFALSPGFVRRGIVLGGIAGAEAADIAHLIESSHARRGAQPTPLVKIWLASNLAKAAA